MTSEEKQSRGSLLSVVDLMHVCVNPGNLPAFIKSLTGFFKQHTGCHAVGVRLREGEDFPYYETQGFPPEFVLAENKLCAVDPEGELVRDSQGNPVMECMCGNILCGQTDPSKPFFTPRGSFFSGRTTELLASTTEADRQARTRNRCNGEGYETVVLIPLRWQGKTFGLCQFNDRRKDFFSAEQISQLELMAECAAITLAKLESDEALRQSEEEFHLLSQLAPVGIYIADPQGKCLYANDFWLEMAGMTLSQALGMGWVKGIHPDDRLGVFESWNAMVAANGHWGKEYRFQDKKGKITWVYGLAAPQKKADGSILRYLGINVDITERKRAEEALCQSEEQFRTLVENAPVLVNSFSETGRCTLWNAECEKTFGWTFDEIAAHDDPLALFYPDPTIRKHVMDSVILGPERCYREWHPRTKDGRELTTLWANFRLACGTVISIGYDITERKRVDERLKDSEAKYRTLVDEAVEMLFLHDMEGAIIDVNQAAILATGYSREELLKMRVYDIDPDADVRHDQKQIWEAMPHQESKQFDVRHKRKDGSIYWAEVRAGKLMLKGVPYIMALANDISERKKAKEEREARIKKLQSKNEEMGNILFIAGHDLRGPLVNVQGFAGELEKSLNALKEELSNSDLPKTTRDKLNLLLKTDIPESLHFIKEGSQMMNTLLSGLLRLSRISKTGGDHPVVLDVNQLIGNICKGLRFRIQESQVDLQIDGSLPACYGDATLIAQVFANLIDNAIKYRKPEGPCKIRIRGHRRSGQSLYRIEDNGIGIAPENKEKIFELFHQLNPSAGGEGVGLTIVRRVLEHQNGKIKIDSEEGSGTIVSVTLPGA